MAFAFEQIWNFKFAFNECEFLTIFVRSLAVRMCRWVGESLITLFFSTLLVRKYKLDNVEGDC